MSVRLSILLLLSLKVVGIGIMCDSLKCLKLKNVDDSRVRGAGFDSSE